jgi:hypothetical protein
MGAVSAFFLKPGAGEQLETLVELAPQLSAAVCGTVRQSGENVNQALVLLFSADDRRLLDRQFTDEDGHFFFGPLEGDRLYLVKIYKNNIKIREVEIVAE